MTAPATFILSLAVVLLLLYFLIPKHKQVQPEPHIDMDTEFRRIDELIQKCETIPQYSSLMHEIFQYKLFYATNQTGRANANELVRRARELKQFIFHPQYSAHK